MLFNKRRFIICTSPVTGECGNKFNQNQVSNRGQAQGENQNKNLKTLTKTKTNIGHYAPIVKSSLYVGLFLISSGLVLNANSIEDYSFGISTAHAASVSDNFAFTKDVVREIAPNVSFDNGEMRTINDTPEGFLEKPLVAETTVTNEPKKVAPKVATQINKPVVATKVKTTPAVAVDESTTGHSFPYGYCTYYASQRRVVPWGGNAITWLSGARSFGFATGSTPQAGAIMVTSEGGRAGHVAVVDAVNGDQVTVTEMNYSGFGRISTRTISSSYGQIMGYIY